MGWQVQGREEVSDGIITEMVELSGSSEEGVPFLAGFDK